MATQSKPRTRKKSRSKTATKTRPTVPELLRRLGEEPDGWSRPEQLDLLAVRYIRRKIAELPPEARADANKAFSLVVDAVANVLVRTQDEVRRGRRALGVEEEQPIPSSGTASSYL
jgi:hypothetical protein